MAGKLRTITVLVLFIAAVSVKGKRSINKASDFARQQQKRGGWKEKKQISRTNRENASLNSETCSSVRESAYGLSVSGWFLGCKMGYRHVFQGGVRRGRGARGWRKRGTHHGELM